ncbi:hypothetical protein OA50_00879 [Mameliella alba]|uniref:Uncharacterized protein n=1 Tax=Mameliella alba TaxID=561184 RepID=A0A0B3S1U4_9RHOB|nr:hypothetical protein OA50_00879 [Mameliella alba]
MKSRNRFLGSVSGLLIAFSAAVVLTTASVSPDVAYAQGNGGGGGGGGAGGGGGTGGGGAGGGGAGPGDRGPDRDLGVIFRDITGGGGGNAPVVVTDEAERGTGRPATAGPASGGGGGGTAGGPPANTGPDKGDLFGDLWVILRDENGVPILTDDGFVQPLDAEGNLIALDEEGHPLDETLTVEVELGRLNVGRAPDKVLDTRAAEVIEVLSSATAITTDAAGRLVLTLDGVEKTIDSPLENLAIYVSLLTTGSIPGLTPDDLVGTEFDFLVDGTFTTADIEAAAAFLAAATDKTGAFTSDEIAYIDAFLGINTTTSGDVTYSVIDYSDFSYDRSDTYDGLTASVLVEQDDGSFVVETVDIYDTVFGGTDASDSGSLDAFTLAADDARAVIEFIHEYAVPESME